MRTYKYGTHKENPPPVKYEPLEGFAYQLGTAVCNFQGEIGIITELTLDGMPRHICAKVFYPLSKTWNTLGIGRLRVANAEELSNMLGVILDIPTQIKEEPNGAV